MADELWETLLRFHREVLAPEFEARLDAYQRKINAHFRNVDSQFAELHRRLDRLEQIGREHRQDPAGR